MIITTDYVICEVGFLDVPIIGVPEFTDAEGSAMSFNQMTEQSSIKREAFPVGDGQYWYFGAALSDLTHTRASMKTALKDFIGGVELSGDDFSQTSAGLAWCLNWQEFEAFKKESPFFYEVTL